MILVPMVITARLVDANVWSYMAFGSLYANWLTMIHSEHAHPWDSFFRTLGAYLTHIPLDSQQKAKCIQIAPYRPPITTGDFIMN